jgi:hypothetical protein
VTWNVASTVNDYDVRLVKVQGEFVRHQHPYADCDGLARSGRR